MPSAVAEGEITALHLFGLDPVRELANRGLWEQALGHAGLIVAHASVLSEGLREHAHVIFPAESYAEKEGTVVHPDGRIQRLRTAIAHPGQVRAGWWVIAEIAKRAGLDTGVLTSGMAWRQLADAVPFYGGLTLEEIGGRGLRWPELEQASRLPAPAGSEPRPAASPRGVTSGAPARGGARGLGGPAGGRAKPGSLRLGTYRSIWAAPEVEASPALHFARAEQQVELSPEDARTLGVSSGDGVWVSQNGTRLAGRAHVRTGLPAGTTFLAVGLERDSANALTEPLVEVSRS
jgi:NADH-quinone oxidoreductase subunit G